MMYEIYVHATGKADIYDSKEVDIIGCFPSSDEAEEWLLSYMDEDNDDYTFCYED